MRYKFKIQKGLYGTPKFTIDLQEDKMNLWYKEQSRRFTKMYSFATEEGKQKYMKEFPIFDIDESYELGIMSPEHFEAMDNYLFNK